MPDSTGFGDYTESGQIIPVIFRGEKGGYVHAMCLNDHPPIAGGRELWGLAVCYSVLKKQSGHIMMKLQPGKGSSFILHPSVRARQTEEIEIKKKVSTGKNRVLIMDDDIKIVRPATKE